MRDVKKSTPAPSLFRPSIVLHKTPGFDEAGEVCMFAGDVHLGAGVVERPAHPQRAGASSSHRARLAFAHVRQVVSRKTHDHPAP